MLEMSTSGDEPRNKLRGVIAFPITPFEAGFFSDIPVCKKNPRRTLETPIAAIVAAGGTGETDSLTPTAEEARRRIPFINSYADEEGLANYYAEIGRATSLGLLVYSRDWVNPSPAWVEQLAAHVPSAAGAR
jgi:dihydrodipicolinate synthase/N-acetylneuraminate lyase